MEKKNTILLTVIAIATLLVAVVGATFAYYSVGTTFEQNATTYKATTGKIGSIAQTLINQNLALKITPEDMIQLDSYEGDSEKSFWAKNTTAGSLGNSNYEDHEVYREIVKVELSNGDDKTKYTCTGTITVKAGSGDSMISVAEQDDIKLYLKTSTSTTIGSDNNPQGNEVTLDLKELKDVEDKTKTYNVIYKVSGTEESKTATISAALKLVNRNTDQKYLAGKTLALEITTPTFNCDIDAIAD